MALSDDVRDRAGRNLDRVRHLVSLYEDAVGTGRGRRGLRSSDMLRAATVLLHATLEDFLRGVAQQFLPSASAEVLNTVPLVGTSGRPEKFFLGALAKHRSKKVERVIQDSVEAHLTRSTFNNTSDIKSVLAVAGVDHTLVSHLFPDLDEMMQRRHHIVHQADRNPARGRGQHQAKSIGRHVVRRWIDSVSTFFDLVEGAIT